METSKAVVRQYFVATTLACCVAISVIMAILQPVPHGHQYDNGVRLSLSLLCCWLLSRVRPSWFFRKEMAIAALLVAAALGIINFVSINPTSEAVFHYRTVFAALENGVNPYTSGTIYHRTEFRRVVYGNFNYPPLEIYPYCLAYLIAGRWDSTVLTATMLALNLLACLVFVWTFPRIRLGALLPFLSFFLVAEIKTSVPMTFLMTTLIVRAIKRDTEHPRHGPRYAIAGLFGLGLTTKYLVMPLMAAYYWNRFDRRNLRSLVGIAAEAGLALAVAFLMIAPFGVVSVFKSTILFNLILKDRAVQTTFFPNVLSGPLSWAGQGGLYSVVAVAILGLSILVAPRLDAFSAMLTAGCTFLFVAPTPEPQFVPTLVYLVLVAKIMTVEREGSVPGVFRPSSDTLATT